LRSIKDTDAVRRSFKRAWAVTALLAVASPVALTVAVALHLADDHLDGSAHHGGARDLETVLHGHTHDKGTAPHGHPFLTSDPAPMPAKQQLLVAARVGDAPEPVVPVTSGRRLPAAGGPTHDPPGRVAAPSVLRI